MLFIVDDGHMIVKKNNKQLFMIKVDETSELFLYKPTLHLNLVANYTLLRNKDLLGIYKKDERNSFFFTELEVKYLQNSETNNPPRGRMRANLFGKRSKTTPTDARYNKPFSLTSEESTIDYWVARINFPDFMIPDFLLAYLFLFVFRSRPVTEWMNYKSFKK